MHTADNIVSILQTQIATLVRRQWHIISELLSERDEDEQIKLGFSASIGDFGKPVSLDLSFSKRFKDHVESVPEDPAQPSLNFDSQTPAGKLRFEQAEVIEAAKRDHPEESLMRVHLGRFRELHPECAYQDTDEGLAAFIRDIGALKESASAPEGGDVEAGQGNTPLGEALDASAVRALVADIDLDLSPEVYPTSRLMKDFKRAAKKAGWHGLQIATICAVLTQAADLAAMKETLRPFVRKDEPAPGGEPDVKVATVPDDAANATWEGPVVDGVNLPRVPVTLEPKMAAPHVIMTFRKAAGNSEWPDAQIETIADALTGIAHSHNNLEPDAGDSCRAELAQFVCAPEA